MNFEGKPTQEEEKVNEIGDEDEVDLEKLDAENTRRYSTVEGWETQLKEDREKELENAREREKIRREIQDLKEEVKSETEKEKIIQLQEQIIKSHEKFEAVVMEGSINDDMISVIKGRIDKLKMESSSESVGEENISENLAPLSESFSDVRKGVEEKRSARREAEKRGF